LRINIDFKTDFFRPFTDIHLGTYRRLPDFFTVKVGLSTIHIGGFYPSHLELGGRGWDILKGTKLK
jgi:hypothetical protein